MLQEAAMTDEKLMVCLKVCIFTGICLILLGVYLHNFSDVIEAMAVNGIIISAMCVAFGMILSLPTKMYLTFLLVMREAEANRRL